MEYETHEKEIEAAILALIKGEVSPDNYNIEDHDTFWAKKIVDLLVNLELL